MKFNMHPSLVEFLRHIKIEIEFCLAHSIGRKYEDFVNDPILSRAVIRSLEIIGEASKKIPSDFKSQFPMVQWKDVGGMRDRLIHQYFGVDYEIVWNTLNEDLPVLKEWIDIMLAFKWDSKD